jgi:hypothetical protein
MVEGAVQFITIVVGALLGPEEHLVVLQLFPAMALGAIEGLWAALRVLSDEFLCIPVGTGYCLVLEDLELPPEVLPVVGVHTERLESFNIYTLS